MRKSISTINESKITKYCNLAEKMIKDLNTTASNKLRLIKADDEMGDIDNSKLGKLDDFIQSLDNTISLLSKL